MKRKELNSNLTEIQNYCANKTIIVFGNAQSLLSSDINILDIEQQYDIVVKINKGATDPAMGKRCDIHCHSSGEKNIIKRPISYVKFYFYMSPYKRNQVPSHYNFFPLYHYEKLNKMIKTKDKRPSTGLMTVYMFLQFEYKYLHIIGFDFGKTKTYYNNFDGLSDKHSGDDEEKIFRKWERENLIEIL